MNYKDAQALVEKTVGVILNRPPLNQSARSQILASLRVIKEHYAYGNPARCRRDNGAWPCAVVTKAQNDIQSVARTYGVTQ